VRVAIFVLVVAVHIALIWLFPSVRRVVLPAAADEPLVTPIFLPPLSPAVASKAAAQVDREAKTRTSGPRRQLEANSAPPRSPRAAPTESSTQPPPLSPEPASTQSSTQSSTQTSTPSSPPTSVAPDWRSQAEITAQTSAQHIVAAEDDAARKAAALTSHFKPLPGPRAAGPQFAWDYAHTHRYTPLQGGGFVIALNDRCNLAVVIFLMIGCSVGDQPKANGDLFKNMHPPVKFGDWDWRLDDP
jgi:hypothetical protein